jgi:hypothetical protein
MIGDTMGRFFPTAERVIEARRVLATGHYGDLDSLMCVAELQPPHESDLKALVKEFGELAAELDLNVDGAFGFVVLAPVTVNGATHTTPILVDPEYCELSFTSHPELGAETITDEILVANPRLLGEVREELLGVLATWHNRTADDQ